MHPSRSQYPLGLVNTGTDKKNLGPGLYSLLLDLPRSCSRSCTGTSSGVDHFVGYDAVRVERLLEVVVVRLIDDTLSPLLRVLFCGTPRSNWCVVPDNNGRNFSRMESLERTA